MHINIHLYLSSLQAVIVFLQYSSLVLFFLAQEAVVEEQNSETDNIKVL